MWTAWARRELAHWRSNPVDLAYRRKRFRRLNDSHAWFFIYHIAGGEVHVEPKPESLAVRPLFLARAHKYQEFFQEVATQLPLDFTTCFAMGLDDRHDFSPSVPIFCFQKRRGSHTVLVPDIDFLNFGFYDSHDATDELEFEDKLPGAIFVGGTSGGPITLEVARTCSLPRLRAARYFQDSQRVEFRLPSIVQTTSPEAQSVLESLPFCGGARVSWQEQLTRRCLISMDGNGATCSRVVLSLRSNSVLFKYESEELLYYFHGLQPWLHYVPISQDSDVETWLDLDAHWPGTLKRIAIAGRKFAEAYLTREAVTAYMAELLVMYEACFTQGAPARPASRLPRRVARPRVFLSAHVEGVGDVVADADGWVGDASAPRCIEGFTVSVNVPRWSRRVRCQAVGVDGTFGAAVAGGDYCGSKGKQLPLCGFVLLDAGGGEEWRDLTYEGVFLDGFCSGPLKMGQVCVSPANAALVAMWVGMGERSREQEPVL